MGAGLVIETSLSGYEPNQTTWPSLPHNSNNEFVNYQMYYI